MKNKVQKILNKIRPYIQMHGGDVFLVDTKDGIVTIKIIGTCAHCSLSNITYNNMLGDILKEEIPKFKKIIIKT